MIFTKEVWQQAIDGYLIVGCAIRNKNRQVFLLVEDTDVDDLDVYARKRFLFTYNDESDPAERYYYIGSDEYDVTQITYNPTENETIGIDISGLVYSHSAGQDRDEARHPNTLKDAEIMAVITNVKTIGTSVYSVAMPHRLYRRKGVSQWQELSDSLPVPDMGDSGENAINYGWNDVSGFSEDDMYMVGGLGDVWHFNGTSFTQCDFPSNELLSNVCCADDGYVYIGGNLGRLWRGKDNAWQLISSQEFIMPWKNVTWCFERLFLGSDYGLWEFLDGEVKTANVPAQVKMCSGAISTNVEKTLLLTAGQNGASLFDGKKWEILFDGLDLNNAYI